MKEQNNQRKFLVVPLLVVPLLAIQSNKFLTKVTSNRLK